MRNRFPILIANVALLAAVWGGAGLPAQETRFRPEDCFPAESLVYLSVGSIERFQAGLGGTIFGKIASHPGVKAALGALPDFALAHLRAATEGFQTETGIDVVSALSLLRGEVAAVVAGPKRFALAVELGPNREAMLDLLKKIDRLVEEGAGAGELPSMKIGNHPISLWPMDPGAQVARAVLGTHVVFAIPSDFMTPIVLAFDGTPAGPAGEKKAGKKAAGLRALKDAPFLTTLRPRLKLTNPELLLAINVEGVRALLTAAPEEGGPPEDLGGVLAATGFSGVSTAGYAMGFRDGDFEAKFHLATPGGPQGVLGAITGAIRPMEALDGALALLPAQATAVSAVTVQPGKLISGVLDSVKLAFPDAAPTMDMIVHALESRFAISLSEDVAPLPPIGMVGFTMSPPAGALFDDSLALVRSSEFEPYRRLLAKLDSSFGREPGTVEERGRKILYSSLCSFLPLDNGWTVIADTPQGLRRYVGFYQSSPKASQDARLIQSLRERLSGASGGVVLRTGRSLLSAYNTGVSLLNLLAPSLQAYLDPFKVDLGLLPPGEEFLGEIRDGFLRLDAGREGLTVHAHRVISSSGATSIAAAIGIIAGITIPAGLKARQAAEQAAGQFAPPGAQSQGARSSTVRCQNNLREILKLGLVYADGQGKGVYPFSPKGGIAALQILVDENDEVIPGTFVCPNATQKPAARGADGKFKLDEGHSSYQIVPWKVKPTDPADCILAFDSAPVHDGSRNVVFLDGSVIVIREEDFQKRYEDQEKRFAAPAEKPGKPGKTGQKKKK